MKRRAAGPRGAARVAACAVAVAIVSTVAGCATPRAPVPRFRGEATVAAGTTREDLLLRWGVPSRVFEDGCVLTWRIRGGVAADPVLAFRCPALRPLDRRETSLVVVFDAAGRVTAWAAVAVDAPATPTAPL